MPKNSYDIIGDIHGRFDKLEPLLKALGYHHDGTCFTHPDSTRKAIFLGDLIDPKNEAVPNGTREVLHTVKAMVDHDKAASILGNHEYNFVAYRTRKEPCQGFIRPRTEKNVKMHAGTEQAFEHHPAELDEVFLPWLKRLPFFLDLPEIRIVHACWHPESLRLLRERTLADLDFLRKSGIKGSPEYHAVETVLKGMEIKLPKGQTIRDPTGIARPHLRARWWDANPDSPTARSVAFPFDRKIPDSPLAQSDLRFLPGYDPTEKPLFIGHYFKPWGHDPGGPYLPEAANLFCLDFSAATDGPLAAYQWRLEGRELTSDNLLLAAEVREEAGKSEAMVPEQEGLN